ncbi:MAG: hypothetical protein AB1689_25670 [Thermodesulfobacteriota bacterium]
MSTEATRRDHLEVGRDPEDRRALEQAIEAGHEVDTVRARVLRFTVIGVTSLIAIGVLVVWLVEPWLVGRQRDEYPPANPLAKTYGRSEPPAPRLQVDPKLDIYEHRRAEERLLSTYGWVDRKAGVVRIPIERAIDLLAQRAGDVPPRPEGGAGMAIDGARGGQP